MRTGARFLTLALVLWLAPAGAALAEKINAEVQQSRVERDKQTREAVIIIELTAAGRNALAEFTARHIGRNIEVRIGTTTLLKARLKEKIEGGIISATTKFTEDEAKKISAQLARGTLIELEDVAD